MAGSFEDFLEITQQEAEVDILRLRSLAFYGIPESLRMVVWPLLLDYLPSAPRIAGPRDAVSRSRPVDMNKLYRDELSSYGQDLTVFQSAKTRERMQAILFRVHQHDPYLPEDTSLVHLLGPCVFALRRMDVVEVCFLSLIRALDQRPANREVNLKRFMILFRSRLPQLYSHFEDEDLDPRLWATSWLQCLFAKRLALPCLIRLWDAYFSANEGFDLHVFVCLALLADCQEDLLDMSHQELRAFMKSVPCFDVDRLVSNALDLKSDFIIHDEITTDAGVALFTEERANDQGPRESDL